MDALLLFLVPAGIGLIAGNLRRFVQYLQGGPVYFSKSSECVTLGELYELAVNSGGDLSPHLATLRTYAEVSRSVLELGVKFGASTVAFLSAGPQRLVSIDVDWSNLPPRVLELAPNNVRWTRIVGDSRIVHPPAKLDYDFVFIDTRHTADQVRSEIKAWEPYARRWMAFHDTAQDAFGAKGEDGQVGIELPIRDLLESGRWRVREHTEANNGLTILERRAG